MTAIRREFFKILPDGAQIFLRVSPAASENGVAGLWRSTDGEVRLAVKVIAPPDKGKANIAVLKLLSKHLGLPKSMLSITAGECARLKTVSLQSDPDVLNRMLKCLPEKLDDCCYH